VSRKFLAVACYSVFLLAAILAAVFLPKEAQVSAASHAGNGPAYTPIYSKDGDLAPPLQ
jgi:hypothetical protein